MKYRSLFFLFTLFLFSSCTDQQIQETEADSTSTVIFKTSHFSIEKKGYYTIISVNSPFVGSDLIDKYVLYPKDSLKPELENVSHFFSTPIERVAINSTTHLGFLSAIGKEKEVVAASNLELYYSPSFNDRITNGEVGSIGNRQLDVEQLIDKNSDVLFSFAIDASGYQEAIKLRKLGQKVVLIAEFMESDPLLKASWLRVFAEFFNRGEKANQILEKIEKKYRAAEAIANKAENKPTVMMGLPWKGSWYVSGGSSFQANYYMAAGSNYIWQEIKQEGGIPLTFEKVIQDALDSDFWLNPGAVSSKSGLQEKDSRFKSFQAFKNNNIFTNYKRSNAKGANDYWESGMVHADKVLSDLVAIFHPDLMKDYNLYYYHKLAEIEEE